MMMALLALCSAACWGAGDFLGGWAARHVHLLSLALASHLSGAAVLGLVVLFRGVDAPGADVVPVAIATGFVSFFAILGLYASLALGVMARIAPIFATSALVPIIIGLAEGEEPSLAQFAGIALALGGVATISSGPARTAAESRMRIAVPLALATAICSGFALVGIDRAAEYDQYWGVFLIRIATVSFSLLAAIIVFRRRLLSDRRPAPIGVPIGCLEVGGATLFGLASTHGLLSLAAVLASTFPVVTVLLAIFLLDERMTRVHAWGAAATLAGSALIIVG